MIKSKKTKPEVPEVEIIEPTIRLRPALDPASRENQLINLAMDQAEEQLRSGTASPSVITHFLKLGSIREQEEMDLLRNQKILVKAKADSIESSKKAEELTTAAIDAMKQYGGSSADDHA